MRRVALIAAAALAVTGCASYGRMMSYGDGMGSDLADGKFDHDGRDYAVWVHRTDPTVMVQRRLSGKLVGKAAFEGLTFGVVNTADPGPVWRDAAQHFLDPAGCKVTEIYPLSEDTSWEATFTCPEGVDLKALVVAQREALRKGEPLKL